ncbi:hypothetical protein P171DRAFT_100979 [Karstenula rhodostoma CBS 690.94]|uniref:Uncharacterized protein n=1 Tax=Karstenula rhodostoma CBS 690.94 TaxID=1392251 RepID=A0A9P4U8R2_9PLEO|nr:hypothetical protein P171DRAFT_100979 [Karstenula rhodostoma CBS 690.94]
MVVEATIIPEPRSHVTHPTDHPNTPSSSRAPSQRAPTGASLLSSTTPGSPHVTIPLALHPHKLYAQPNVPTMKLPITPPYSDPGRADSCGAAKFRAHAPISPAASSPDQAHSPARTSAFLIPADLTQAAVEASPQLKRLQQDLLILTSFADNSSLSWRPSWFSAPVFSSVYWTLHNPPDVVTEELPRAGISGRQVMTRRMREEGDRSRCG